MGRLIRVLGVVPLALFVGGCDLDGFWEKFYQGTTKGFAYCKAAGEKQGLSKNVVRQYCVDRHQQTIKANLTGRASYDGNPTTGFSGTIKNESVGVIVTEYTVIVNHSKALQSNFTETYTVKGVWVEPRETHFFVIRGDNLRFKPEAGTETKSDQFSWDTSIVRGLKISF